ncbi:MAG: FAD-dependent oxidoreductase [Dehalococcoidia bacterium]
MVEMPAKWDVEADVVVLGTGAAGLTAAITAHDEGAKVCLVEKAPMVGGTTAFSGGVPWIPNNHHFNDVDYGQGTDSREDALTYLRFLARGQVRDEILEVLVDNGPEMIKHIEDNTDLQFIWSGQPDYHPEKPGAKRAGRSLGPPAFDSNTLGEWKNKVRLAPIFCLPLSWNEIEEANSLVFPTRLDYEEIGRRMTDGIMGMGMAFIGYLLKACLERGIEPLLETAAKELITRDERVVGVRAERGGDSFYISARKGVILACGGFEWNEELKARFLPGPTPLPLSPPSCEGDGLKMAMALGADLGNMTGYWGTPASLIPGEECDGKQLTRLTIGERQLPHAMVVNRYGKRFMNESHNYNDITKAFGVFDANDYEYTNLPAWSIFDQQFREKYAVLTVMPGMPTPEWVTEADTIEELAKKTGIDPEGLTSTIGRFNSFAREGVDSDFRRGESYYDQCVADPTNTPNPCLGTIEKPPFYAMPVYPGALGTKGGPVVNRNGQVMHVSGNAIEGLYAAGNAMAGVTGPGYGGAGGTIGPAMTWGYIAARHAAGLKK